MKRLFNYFKNKNTLYFRAVPKRDNWMVETFTLTNSSNF